MKTRNETTAAVRTIQRSIILSVAAILAALNGRLSAQSGSTQFVAFEDFVASTATASSSEYLARPGSHVEDAAAFEQMRQHILKMYQGVQVDHSFVEDSQYFDCIPVLQQPAARLLGITKIEAPPEPPLGDEPSSEEATPANDTSATDALDEFGNSVNCEKKTVPVRRITLDEVTRFKTLDSFFGKDDEKCVNRGTDQPRAPVDDDPKRHRYATKYQEVKNLGGESDLSLWDPLAPPENQSSISQQWYVGGKGEERQTVEGGWIKNLNAFGPHSVLFIFYTPDNYHTCYWNLEGGKFVQEDESWKLGGPFPDGYSVKGGQQRWFSMEWLLVPREKGSPIMNWWLRLKRQTDKEWKWIGYYPQQVFNGGQMTMFAEKIAYGGETTNDSDLDYWPRMGSGEWPTKGWQWASYHSNIMYTDMDRYSQKPHLNRRPTEPYSNCYRVATPAVENPEAWGTYFFFGGRGGKDCTE